MLGEGKADSCVIDYVGRTGIPGSDSILSSEGFSLDFSSACALKTRLNQLEDSQGISPFSSRNVL